MGSHARHEARSSAPQRRGYVPVAAEPERPVVALEGLRVTRSGREVLHGVDLEVRPGEVVGIVGPSGGGKSTLMRAIVGVQDRVSGTAEVLGHRAGAATVRGRVGYVTQAPSVYADLTARENLAFFASIQRVGRPEVDRALAAVDLAGAADQVVSSMSGGQRSRVSLATALLGSPPLLVLDEPTVGLDPVLRHDLWETFRGLAASGAAVLVSTHVMDEAERCDRVVLVRDGRVIGEGTPAALRARTGAATVEDAFLAIVQEKTA
ncbi:MAG: ABC transporter ATP-binding protein [Actinomycetaceae bacterium]